MYMFCYLWCIVVALKKSSKHKCYDYKYFVLLLKMSFYSLNKNLIIVFIDIFGIVEVNKSD